MTVVVFCSRAAILSAAATTYLPTYIPTHIHTCTTMHKTPSSSAHTYIHTHNHSVLVFIHTYTHIHTHVQNRSVLVFCPSKAACETSARHIASLFASPLPGNSNNNNASAVRESSDFAHVRDAIGEANHQQQQSSSSSSSVYTPPRLRYRRMMLVEELGRTPAGLDPALEVSKCHVLGV